MRCERVQQLYTEYASHGLVVTVMARVEEHLARCPECRGFYDLNDRLADLLRSHGRTPHPGDSYFDGMSQRVLSELARRPTPRRAALVRAVRQPLWWAGMAAAAMLVAVGLSPLASLMHPDSSSSLVHLRLAALAESLPPVPLVQGLEEAPAQGGVVLNKGLHGQSGETAEWGRLDADRIFGGLPADHPRTPSELQAVREAEASLVALRREAGGPDAAPERLLEQIQIIRGQVIAGGTVELRADLRELEAIVRSQLRDPEAVARRPLMRQGELYFKGEDEMATGRPDEALEYFQRVLLIDDGSPWARRADLQMADLFHGEKANFRQALRHYRRCAGEDAAEAFNSAERQRIERMIEILEMYSDRCFEPLARAHEIRRGAWPESVAALRDLIAVVEAGPLLPEVARSIVERIQAGDRPETDQLLEIYSLLADKARSEADNARAYLELYLGELAIQLARPEQAISHFMASTAAAGDSIAGRMARAKLEHLQEQSLQNLVRNRN